MLPALLPLPHEVQSGGTEVPLSGSLGGVEGGVVQGRLQEVSPKEGCGADCIASANVLQIL